MTRFSFAASLLIALTCAVDLLPAWQGPESSVDAIVQEIRNVEQQVKLVVENNMAACVAVDDGIGMGSGVIISKDGYVLTAGHVMVGRGRYQVLLPDGRTANAIPYGRNLNVDAGLLKITDAGPWPHVEIGKSSVLSEGDWVVSLGHSGGFELGRRPPVRTGRITSKNENQLVTDAVLIGGDSGGPLFDLEGKLVAIHSSIGDSIAENRHVKIEIFERDFERMRRGESWGQLPELSDDGSEPKPPKMGIRIDRKSAQVTMVKPESPAANVGVRKGDVVLEFDGVELSNGQQLIDMIKSRITGDVVRMKIKRDERILELEIRLR